MKKVTILLPAYNEEASFPILERCMRQVLDENPAYEWEFLLVNDGSSDGTLREMMRLHQADAHYNYVDLSRNYGKEIAMMAGLDYATGDAVIIMDADMQHPVSVIPEMLRWWEEGFDDVYAQRAQSRETWFKRKSSQWYYRLLASLSRVPVQKDTGDFRLLDRTCVDALRQMREVERNTKGMYSWIGFHKKGITYSQQERRAGTSKWGFMSLLNLALNGITSYTTAPLRLASILGLLVSAVAFIYLVYIIVVTNVWGEPVAGYPTIMVTMLFLGGVQLLSLGILGEYLGRIFNEVKQRPGYFVNSYNGKRGASPASQNPS
ncbi:MAG: glycosyltransferase [Muribaculaceae bacterium]|nr:glycosyltransferase [Muribaculaceae bacterium]